MTGYINNFKDNTKTRTISLRVNDKQLLKNYNKIWKKNWKANEYRFWKQNFYGDDDDDKYIKTKIKIYNYNIMTNFH